MNSKNFSKSLKKSPDGEVENSSDRLLRERIADNDSSAFWELWRHHHDYLYSLCLKWMNYNESNAYEVLSFSMLKAQEKIPMHALKITNTRAWLTCLARNTFIDLIRKEKRTISISGSFENDFIQQDINPDSYHYRKPEEELLSDELSLVLQCLIHNLPENLRLPFALRFSESCSYEEISGRLQISEASARKRIQNARLVLRRKLKAYLSGEDKIFDFSGRSPFSRDENRLHLESCLRSSCKAQAIEETRAEKIFYPLSVAYFREISRRQTPLTCACECF